jgi:hypothetical protein
MEGHLVTEAQPRPPVVLGQPPVGYSMVGLWTDESRLLKWYAAAVKAHDNKPYVMSYDGELYTLWVKKTKGEGKMVGKGWK